MYFQNTYSDSEPKYTFLVRNKKSEWCLSLHGKSISSFITVFYKVLMKERKKPSL